MRIFVYEFLVGGGWHALGLGVPPASLATEGLAMLRALATDFGRIVGVRVSTMCDRRAAALDLKSCDVHAIDPSSDERVCFQRLAKSADWTVVIAPETEGILLDRCRLTIESGGRLLGGSLPLIEIVSDKHHTCQRLAAASVPVPHGVALATHERLPASFCYPAVLKPRDGAGSQDMRLVHHHSATADSLPVAGRLETFCPGTPVSVAFLCGPVHQIVLPACLQRLADDGSFTYLGGALPLPPDLARRAESLARRAIESLPQPLGYLGIDLVLGASSDGAGDVVIEVNPRLTTSYVGLREAANTNLAAAMLEIAEGRPAAVRFDSRALEFDSSGAVRDRSENCSR